MDTLLLYILTFNCARNPIDTDLVAAHLFDTLPPSAPAPHLLVLSLQELAPIAPAFLGGHHLTPYFDAFTHAVTRAAAARFPYAQQHQQQQQQQQEQQQHYVRLATDHVGMTALMVFARTDVAPRLGAVQTARVGLGLQQMGNKGAVGVRVRYSPVEREGKMGAEQESVEMTFVGAHLAPAEDAFERRNRDWRGIVERLVFEGTMRRSVGGEREEERRGEEEGNGDGDGEGEESERAALLGSDSTDTSVEVAAVDPDADTDVDAGADATRHEQGIFTPSGYLFLAGDLNYRTSNTLPLPEDPARFPRLDVDANDPLHWAQLLPRDQLTRERNQGRCFHGLSEAPVTFPPTYKYRIGSRDSRHWAWTRSRWPSWCDRVLYLEDRPGLAVTVYGYDALPLFPTSDHRAVALAAGVTVPVAVPVQQEPSKPTSKSQSRSLSQSETGEGEGEGESRTADGQVVKAPFPIDRDWKRKRDEARRKELVVGGLAYLVLTWEGQRLLLAMVVGGLGAWFVLRSLFGR